MPIALWSYPTDPPEAKASPIQNPRSIEILFAMSENVAVPLSAATTKYGSSMSWRTTLSGATTSPFIKLSVTSSNAPINIW